MSHLNSHYRLVAVFLLAAAIAQGIAFWRERARIMAGYGDFAALYTAGLLLRRGEGSLLYDGQEQWKVQQEFASKVDIRKGPMPFVRPPFEALAFLPLAFFPYPVALAIWSLAKIVLLWFTARVLPRGRPFYRVYPSWLEVAMLLGFFPLFLDLLQGQDSVLLLLILAAVLNRLRFGKDIAAGVILGFGLFKFHLVVPIAIMVWLTGRARILAGFLPVASGLVTLSCMVSGAGVLFGYPAYLFNLNRASGVGFVTAQSMPNLRGMLTAFVGRSPYPGPIHWLLLLAAVAGIALTVRLWRPLIIASSNAGFAGLGLGYCMALVVAILTSYYAYTYDMTLLIIPLLLLGGGFLDEPSLRVVPRTTIAVGLLVAIFTPLYWFLIFRAGRPYLLVIPMVILAFGIARAMQQFPRALYDPDLSIAQ